MFKYVNNYEKVIDFIYYVKDILKLDLKITVICCL